VPFVHEAYVEKRERQAYARGVRGAGYGQRLAEDEPHTGEREMAEAHEAHNAVNHGQVGLFSDRSPTRREVLAWLDRRAEGLAESLGLKVDAVENRFSERADATKRTTDSLDAAIKQQALVHGRSCEIVATMDIKLQSQAVALEALQALLATAADATLTMGKLDELGARVTDLDSRAAAAVGELTAARLVHQERITSLEMNVADHEQTLGEEVLRKYTNWGGRLAKLETWRDALEKEDAILNLSNRLAVLENEKRAPHDTSERLVKLEQYTVEHAKWHDVTRFGPRIGLLETTVETLGGLFDKHRRASYEQTHVTDGTGL
jgi:hypothetical protein